MDTKGLWLFTRFQARQNANLVRFGFAEFAIKDPFRRRRRAIAGQLGDTIANRLGDGARRSILARILVSLAEFVVGTVVAGRVLNVAEIPAPPRGTVTAHETLVGRRGDGRKEIITSRNVVIKVAEAAVLARKGAAGFRGLGGCWQLIIPQRLGANSGRGSGQDGGDKRRKLHGDGCRSTVFLFVVVQ